MHSLILLYWLAGFLIFWEIFPIFTTFLLQILYKLYYKMGIFSLIKLYQTLLKNDNHCQKNDGYKWEKNFIDILWENNLTLLKKGLIYYLVKNIYFLLLYIRIIYLYWFNLAHHIAWLLSYLITMSILFLSFLLICYLHYPLLGLLL